jgi:hypothetical protein
MVFFWGMSCISLFNFSFLHKKAPPLALYVINFSLPPPTFSTRLKADCFCRTPYQRNDYLMWINNAAKDETKASRLDKMLSELKQGHGYMGMDWGLK